MNKLTIENNINNLGKIAEFIEQFGEENGLSTKVVFELNLILDELITNTISYGYKDDKTHFIDIAIEKEKQTINLQVIDDAQEFDPLKEADVDIAKPLQEKRIGGLGIHLIKSKTDKINYKRLDGKNILEMTKLLKE